MSIAAIQQTNPIVRLAKLGLLATATWAVPAVAQTVAPAAATPAAAEPASAVGEIIVTAQKRSQSTQKIGLSITALGSDQLKQLNVKEVRDVVALVPGFTVAASSRGPAIYTLRGVGFNTPNMSTSSPIGLYMDEIAYPYPVMTEGTAFDLERVEVLKGPQGTLYGRNTTGGLVNSIAVKPSQTTDGYMQVSYGSYQSYGVQGALGGGLTPNLAARLAFNIDRSDQGWQQNIVTGDRLGKVDKMGARLALEWKPSSSAAFLLTGNWVRDKSDTMAGQATYIFAKGLANLGVPASAWSAVGPSLGVPLSLLNAAYTPTNASQANWETQQPVWGGTVGGHNFLPAPLGHLNKDNQLLSASLRATFDLSPGIKLTSLTSYSDFERNEIVDLGSVAVEDGLSNEIGYIRSFSQELRLSGDADTLHWIAGAFYAHDNIQEIDRNWGGVTTDIDPLRVLGSAFLPAGSTQAQIQDVQYGFRDWQNDSYQSVSTKALFGQAEWHFAPTLTMTLGGRFTRDTNAFAGCSRDNGDNSIAATWNAFFNHFLGIPSNVAPGGCVTYLADLTPHLTANPAFSPSSPPEFFVNQAAGAFPTQGLVTKQLNQDNVSGRAALDWQASPDVLVYGYYARGFKSGAFPNVSANVATQYDPATQEQLDAFEAGIKSRPARGVILNGAMFYYLYKNKQVYGYVPDIAFGSLNRIVNIPKSHVYGAEVELTAPIAPGLTFHGAASYLHSKIDQYFGYDDFGVTHDFKGAGFTFTPSLQANAMLNYRTALSESWVMKITLDGRYTSVAHGDLLSNPLFRIDPYTIFDGNITLVKDSKYEIAIFGKNLTNKYYWNSVQLYEDSLSRYAGKPRTWGVSLRTSF